MNRLSPRTAVLLGMAAAVLAELCSVGLLAASGWFITASAIAGLTAGSVFSYIFPSAWVRAFAIGRIAFQYGQRVLLHRAALARVGRARRDFFDRSATEPVVTDRDGEMVDRAVHDADVTGMRLITVTAPLLAFGGAVVASCCAAVVLAPVVTGVIVLFTLATVALVGAIDRAAAARAARIAHVRSESRSEIVDVMLAWPEIVSLGAAGIARRGLDERALAYGVDRRRAGAPADAGGFLIALIGAGAAVVAAGAAAIGGAPAPDVIFLLLLVTGLSTSASTLPAAFAARRAATDAEERLHGSRATVRPSLPPVVIRAGRGRIDIERYGVPATPLHPAQTLATVIEAQRPLVVAGRSGSGKTTLLDALADAIDAQHEAAGHALLVPVDDYLFTGTVAENLRLADPDADEATLRGVLDALGLDEIGTAERIGVGGRAISGGEATRMRIARGILARPAVLLVDEPLAGLDATTSERVLGVLRDRVGDGLLVLAVHDARPVSSIFGDRVRVVDLGG